MGSECRLAISEHEFRIIYLLQQQMGKERERRVIPSLAINVVGPAQARNHP